MTLRSKKEAVKPLLLFRSHLAPVSKYVQFYWFVKFIFRLEVVVVTSSTFVFGTFCKIHSACNSYRLAILVC